MQYKLYSKVDVDTNTTKVKPGNFIVTHGTSWQDRTIEFFTQSPWNHAALIIDDKGTLVELDEKGIHTNTLDDYPADRLKIVAIDLEEDDRQEVVAYARYMMKKHPTYGFITVASIFFKIVTGSRLVVKLDGTMICSEFVARALAQGGVIWDKDPSLISPADLYRKFHK